MAAQHEIDNNSKQQEETAEDSASTKVGSTTETEKVGSKVPDKTNPDKRKPREDGKVQLKESDCWEKLGYSFPFWKKWSILSVIFVIQVSMNFNASVYANDILLLTSAFSISEQAARVGQMIFLIAYAFGSELWAPWSEELGRWPVLQLSLFFVNIWQILCALAPNFGTIVVGRFLGGLSSAGGSVTLGMVADMWDADDQQYAVAFIVFSSVGGSVVGPVVGGFMQTYLDWHWNFWVQLIFGASVQVIHFIFVPETNPEVLLDRQAKKMRKNGDTKIYGPGELKEHRFAMEKIWTIWTRPFVMFFTEPIVLCLSLLSGFSDALIFTFLESYTPVFKQWNFTVIQTGLAFLPLLVGYIIAYLSFIPWIHRDRQLRRKDPDSVQPETRLYWLLYVAPLETIGLFGFAWTSLGPPIPWIAPLIFSALIAIANFSIYMATIDYMIASYGIYSASATGGNALARDFLAGVAAMYAAPFYTNVGKTNTLEWPSTILGCLALIITVPIYLFYWEGPAIRERSHFAQTLASDRKVKKAERGGQASQKNTEV